MADRMTEILARINAHEAACASDALSRSQISSLAKNKARGQLMALFMADGAQAAPMAEQDERLSDGEISDLADEYKSAYTHGGTTFDEFDWRGFAAALIAADRARAAISTPAQPAAGEAKPVAWRFESYPPSRPHDPRNHFTEDLEKLRRMRPEVPISKITPLYTTPQPAQVALVETELFLALEDLRGQVRHFCETYGEADFETARATKALQTARAAASHQQGLQVAAQDDGAPSEYERGWMARHRLAAQVAEPDCRSMFMAACASLAEISDAAGVDPEEAATANGNELILERIATMKEAIHAAVTRPCRCATEESLQVAEENAYQNGKRAGLRDAAKVAEPVRQAGECPHGKAPAEECLLCQMTALIPASQQAQGSEPTSSASDCISDRAEDGLRRGMWAQGSESGEAVHYDYSFVCYSCNHEWETQTPEADCPSCGTTNNYSCKDAGPNRAANDQRDAARLDWLESDACTKVFKIGRTWYARAGTHLPHRRVETLRDAIDAAIESDRTQAPGGQS